MIMNKPAISVIIPLYNKEAIIRRSIDSVLSQSYSNFELIIVNDGSTDGSAEVVKSIDDDRIIYIEQDNAGPSKARNTGIKKAIAEWIVFLDADDEFTPTALDVFMKQSQNYPDADIINCTSYIRYSKYTKRTYHKSTGFIKNVFKYWFYGGLMPGSGHSMFRTEIMKENLYDERIRRFEDAEILFRLLKRCKLYNFNIPTFYVNTTYSNASKARKDVSEDFFGHLDFKGKVGWEKFCLYKIYLEERDNYPEYANRLYPNISKRYDLLLLYKIYNCLK